MICLTESNLKTLIRESYIDHIISEGRNIDHDIVGHILKVKDELNKRNFVCSTKYSKPDPMKRHRDYGLCNIRIDMSIGRGKSMKAKQIARMVSSVCEKMGLNKFFQVSDSGYDGRFCETNFSLKPKYVQRYINQYTQ